jgi:hypothetical protein
MKEISSALLPAAHYPKVADLMADLELFRICWRGGLNR